MEAWALEHPWMTFFIVMELVTVIGYLFKRSTCCRCTEEDE